MWLYINNYFFDSSVFKLVSIMPYMLEINSWTKCSFYLPRVYILLKKIMWKHSETTHDSTRGDHSPRKSEGFFFHYILRLADRFLWPCLCSQLVALYKLCYYKSTKETQEELKYLTAIIVLKESFGKELR